MKNTYIRLFIALFFASHLVFAQEAVLFDAQVGQDPVSVTVDQGVMPINEMMPMDIDSLEYTQGECFINGEAVPCEQLQESLSGFLGIGIAIAIFAFILLLASLVFWVFTLIHALTKPVENKAMWVVVMIFTGAFGSVIYYFIEMRPFNKRMREARNAQAQNTVPQGQSDVK